MSRALLDAVGNYGKAHGMDNIIGPLGFTDMDPEGMLTDGFDQLGTMATLYNYPIIRATCRNLAAGKRTMIM